MIRLGENLKGCMARMKKFNGLNNLLMIGPRKSLKIRFTELNQNFGTGVFPILEMGKILNLSPILGISIVDLAVAIVTPYIPKNAVRAGIFGHLFQLFFLDIKPIVQIVLIDHRLLHFQRIHSTQGVLDPVHFQLIFKPGLGRGTKNNHTCYRMLGAKGWRDDTPHGMTKEDDLVGIHIRQGF